MEQEAAKDEGVVKDGAPFPAKEKAPSVSKI